MNTPNAIFVDSRPDAGRALLALRRGVRTSSWIIAIACVVQMMLFGFVHFTDMRWTEIEAPEVPAPAVIQASDASRTLPGAMAFETVNVALETGPINPNRVHSSLDPFMRRAGGVAVFAGVLGVLALASFASLGAVVSGGSALRGVEKAVTACTWSLALVVITVPWREALSSVPIPGVFSSYDSLVAASEGVNAFGQLGTLSLFSVYLVLPIAALVGAGLIAYRFSESVELGYVAGQEEQFAAAVNKEIEHTAKRGVMSTNNSAKEAAALIQAPRVHAESERRPF